MENKNMPVKIKKADRTKTKILKAAEEVFSDKGYEGGGVDEIAARGKINKALIYYYFKSKENLLVEIMKINFHSDDHLKEVERFYEMILKVDCEGIKRYTEEQFKQWDVKRNLLRVLTVECLRLTTLNKSLNQLEHDPHDKLVDMMAKAGFKVKEPKDRIDFLLKFLYLFYSPTIIFSLLEEKWSKIYNIDRDVIRKKYSEIISEQLCYLIESRKPLVKA
jgi:TetR/AcrR family transcriptional regulator